MDRNSARKLFKEAADSGNTDAQLRCDFSLFNTVDEKKNRFY